MGDIKQNNSVDVCDPYRSTQFPYAFFPNLKFCIFLTVANFFVGNLRKTKQEITSVSN
jgi:hypothetical protein